MGFSTELGEHLHGASVTGAGLHVETSSVHRIILGMLDALEVADSS